MCMLVGCLPCSCMYAWGYPIVMYACHCHDMCDECSLSCSHVCTWERCCVFGGVLRHWGMRMIDSFPFPCTLPRPSLPLYLAPSHPWSPWRAMPTRGVPLCGDVHPCHSECTLAYWCVWDATTITSHSIDWLLSYRVHWSVLLAHYACIAYG
jgi:hypothetical protein